MILAVAGRRIDAVDAARVSFPLKAVPEVKRAVRELFTKQAVEAIVCSAACGADLVALDVAEEMGIRRRIVLPFDQVSFRKTSVTDRPGDWQPLFDRLISAAEQTGDLVILGLPNAEKAYAYANRFLLKEALQLAYAREGVAAAVLIWEGIGRGQDDHTQALGEMARKGGLKVFEVLTR